MDECVNGLSQKNSIATLWHVVLCVDVRIQALHAHSRISDLLPYPVRALHSKQWERLAHRRLVLLENSLIKHNEVYVHPLSGDAANA